MTATVQYRVGGTHDIIVGEPPFEVEVTVRPVGAIEFPERTLQLVKGPFAPEYIPQLIEALEKAHEIANRTQPREPLS